MMVFFSFLFFFFLKSINVSFYPLLYSLVTKRLGPLITMTSLPNLLNVNVSELAHILGCRVSSLPITYLGFLLDALFKAKII
jgi:hypothetical protein